MVRFDRLQTGRFRGHKQNRPLKRVLNPTAEATLWNRRRSLAGSLALDTKIEWPMEEAGALDS